MNALTKCSVALAFLCAASLVAGLCDDGLQNGDETGVDCGGEDCRPCTCGVQRTLQDGVFDIEWLVEGWAGTTTATNVLPVRAPFDGFIFDFTAGVYIQSSVTVSGISEGKAYALRDVGEGNFLVTDSAPFLVDFDSDFDPYEAAKPVTFDLLRPLHIHEGEYFGYWSTDEFGLVAQWWCSDKQTQWQLGFTSSDYAAFETCDVMPVTLQRTCIAPIVATIWPLCDNTLFNDVNATCDGVSDNWSGDFFDAKVDGDGSDDFLSGSHNDGDGGGGGGLSGATAALIVVMSIVIGLPLIGGVFVWVIRPKKPQRRRRRPPQQATSRQPAKPRQNGLPLQSATVASGSGGMHNASSGIDEVDVLIVKDPPAMPTMPAMSAMSAMPAMPAMPDHPPALLDHPPSYSAVLPSRHAPTVEPAPPTYSSVAQL